MSNLDLNADQSLRPILRAGILTDVHYGDKPQAMNRFYRESLQKFQTAISHYNQVKTDFVIELGDLIDQDEDLETELKWLNQIDSVYAKLDCARHYVLGNHCVTNISKFQFASHTRASHRSFYRFEQNGVSFIALDACFREDGVAYSKKNFDWKDTAIPPIEARWLEAQLGRVSGPVVVFVHQRLDEKPNYQIKNAPEIRKILEASKKVIAVFQGHSHKNDYQEIGGIHYVTMAGVVEGSDTNSYGELHVFWDGSLKVQGFAAQTSYDFKSIAKSAPSS